MRVDRLSLTIQTVDGVVVGTAPTSPGYESQDILENAKQVEMHVRAWLDFVKHMHARKNKVFLSLSTPKLPHLDLGLFNAHNICSACGFAMYDADGLCMFVLPCGHAYHIYYFAHLATTKGICMAMGCAQVISPATRSLVMLGHIDAPGYARESQSTIPSMLPNSVAKSCFSHGMYHFFMLSNSCLHYWVFLCIFLQRRQG